MSKRKSNGDEPSADADDDTTLPGSDEEPTNPNYVIPPEAAVQEGSDEPSGETSFDGGEGPDTYVGEGPDSNEWDEAASTQTFAPEGAPAGAEIPLETTAVDVPPVAAPGGEAQGAAAEEPPEAVPAGRLGGIIESLLFASDKPLGVNELKRLVGERDTAKVTAAIEELRERRRETGIHLVSVAGGWHLRTNPENAAWVARILTGKPPRLSRAMLETLAIVAYRQPITRPEIDEIRGVDCGPVLKTLLERGLVRMIGKKEEVGRPLLYGTTPEFLRTFSLRDLTELPTLREFHELGEAELAKVDAKVGAAAPAPDVPAPLPPPKPVVRTLDPAEEDELLDELDRASSAAAKAAAPPPAEGAPPEATPDKPAG
jgi:segregation and condensation protein B